MKPNNNRVKIQQALGVKARRANQIAAGGPALAEAKLKKEQATARLRSSQAERANLELEIARGGLVKKSLVDEEGFALGMAGKAQLLAWVGNLPGRLEGLTAARMVPIFEREVDKVLRTLGK